MYIALQNKNNNKDIGSDYLYFHCLLLRYGMNEQFELHELKVLECIFVVRSSRVVPLEENYIVNYLEDSGFKNPRMVARLAFLKLEKKGYIKEEYGFHGDPSYLLTESGERLFLDHPSFLPNNNVNNLTAMNTAGD